MSDRSGLADRTNVKSAGRLWTSEADGFRHLTLPHFEYDTLSHDAEEQRFLILHPARCDKGEISDHVRCDLETTPLFSAEPFIAVSNARGYRLLQDAIEVNGKALVISCALERFLRHFRKYDASVRLWVRHICLLESDTGERERYWTRDFNDIMYTLATEVVDMSQFVANLVDCDLVEVTWDSRYHDLKKQWNTTPENIVLPHVWPVRLGKRPANIEDAPTSFYDYVPLDTIASEIRVLALLPSADPSAPVILHPGHCPVLCDVTFMALSYSWGQDTTQAEIVMHGQKLLIRRSLENILRTLRSTTSVIPIWIDAISINQADVSEKNRQVRRMGDIYFNAVSVLSYIGPASDDSDMALELIKELKTPMMRLNDKGEWHFGDWGGEYGKFWFGENRIPPARLARLSAALYKLFTRPYFRRAWVLQEVAKASNPTVAVGTNHDIPFEQLDSAAYHLLDMLRNDPSFARRMMDADPSLQEVDIQQLAFVRKLFFFRQLASGDGPLSMVPFMKKEQRSSSFLETLVLARDFESTDPRDKIFAMWNLASDSAGLDIKIDYSEPIHGVYLDFARAWIKQHRSLEMLGAVEASTDSADFYETAPSWCPDWSKAAGASSLILRDQIPVRAMSNVDNLNGALYATDGSFDVDDSEHVPFRVLGDMIECSGIILDSVYLILDQPPDISHDFAFPFGCDPPSYWKYYQWLEELKRHFDQKATSMYDDVTRAAIAMFHGDCSSAWPPRAENTENADSNGEREDYVCIPSASRHILKYAGSYNRSDAWHTVRSVLRGRVPFVSKDGYMGLCPAFIKAEASDKPWLLAIVATCSVPLLLQGRDDGSYRLCGTCFVQGWMEGEVLADMTDSPRSFWEATGDSAKIKIT